MPRVSVCCAVLNQGDWFMEMVASVRKQTFQDWELIVVDDGSTDDILGIVKSFNDNRIRYYRFDENRGIPHGINFAMSEANGDYINPLAADEMITPDKLEIQVAFMDEHPQIDAIWGLPGNGTLGDRPAWEQNHLRAHNRSRAQWIRTLMTLDNVPIGGASMLCRKKLFDELGYFDTALRTFSDHEWFVRFFKAGKQGRILPYRWATSRPNPNGASALSNIEPEKFRKEWEYVTSKHKVEVPPVNPTVTIGIAIYNMAHFLPDALDSVLAQTVQPTEILITDDCSTDNVEEVVKRYNDPRIKFFRFDENRGNMTAQNFMLMQATGDFYTPFAADDKLAPDYVEKCLHQFHLNPWLELVASQTDFMDANGEPLTEDSQRTPFQIAAMGIPKPTNQPRDRMLQQLYYSNIYFGVGMYRTATLREVGGWDKSKGVLADYEMYLRMLQREPIHVIEEPLTRTRLHDKNLSNLGTNKPGEGKTLQELYKVAKQDYYAPRLKVIIATPFYEMKAFSPYVSSLATTAKLLTQLNIEWEFWELAGDSYVARARNTICTKFLEDVEATDLFFIDSDMTWDPEAFIKMLLLPEWIVGGAYPAKNMWETWTSMPTLKDGGNGRLHPVGRPLQDGSALLVADTVATGFMRIKRQALEAFRDHYASLRYKEPGADQSRPDREYIEFFVTKIEDGLWYGEDRMFCKRLKEMGQEMHIYPNVTISHFGVKGWTGNYDKFLKKGQHGDSTGHSSPGV